MLDRIKRPAILLLGLSLVLGLAAAGFLLIPNRLSGGALIQISVGASGDPTESPRPTPASLPPSVPTEAIASERVQGILYNVGSKVVNLADPGGYRYLKINIALEVLPTDPTFYTLSGEAHEMAREEVLADLDEHRAVIEDVITMKLSSKTFEEVFTIAGKEQLKEELREELNTHLTGQKVREIYFTEFVIQ